MTQLIAARLNRGLSVRVAAREIGVARETLAKAERGEPMAAQTAFKIASFYGLTVTDVWPIERDEVAS